MRRLFLHIGSHKTGTTTVQATLQHNEALLLQRGLAVVRGDSLPNLHQYLGFVDTKAILPGGYKTHDPVAFAAMLAAAKADHVFGSSENFSFFFSQTAIDQLAAALKAHFDDIRIIVYLRRQDRHAISHHQEGARPQRRPEGMLWGHSLTALPEPAPQHWLYLDYDHRISMWEKAFGQDNLMVRLFDRGLLKDGDIVPDILALMGYDEHGLVRMPDSNVSLGRLRAKIGHIANEVIGDDAVTEKLLQALPHQDTRMIPSAADAERFLAPYREGNRRLNQRLEITTYPDLFPDDFSDYPEAASEDLTNSAATDGLRAVVATLGSGKTFLHAVTASDLRLAATALQKDMPEAAYRLVEAAHAMKPNGPAIVKLKAELEERLGKVPAK